ncbi:MAG: hypothetical protein AMXMBFR64_46810 [Myxococcales bacterium]
MARNNIQATTLRGSQDTLQPGQTGRLSTRVPGLTIAWHPDVSRVGEQARLTTLVAGRAARLSRMEPPFTLPAGGSARAIDDPYVSRQPLLIEPAGGAVRLVPSGAVTVVDGQPLTSPREISAADLDRGVIIEVAARVVVLLHWLGPPARPGDDLGIVGSSPRVEQVRAQIRQVADLEIPILIRGETGTGKELVARAIHATSPRRGRPWLAVNMGAIPATTAASDLFGHARGAFTGAVKDHAGHFQRMDGGTLFLDEIGEAPMDVQAMLLRVLETGELQPVGSPVTRRVNVRLLAATDTDLEQACAERTFRSALLHRLSGYVISLPPLRERRDDVGRLVAYFLRAELQATGEAWRLEPRDQAPWLPARVVALLLCYGWPGNVRELKNVVRQIVITSRGSDVAWLDPAVERQLTQPQAEAPVPAEQPDTAWRDPNTVTEDELIGALEKNAWKVGAAARALNVSRTSLYALIERSTRVRKASDVTLDEVLAARRTHGEDVDALAGALRVSKRGLLFRLKELGLR